MEVMEFESIEKLASQVTGSLKDARSLLLYAQNSTGKTRISQHLKEADPKGVLLYNAILEDAFTWDNEEFVLRLNTESGLFESVATQGLDTRIVENFQRFTRGKIEPTIDMDVGEVSFGIHTGDNTSTDNIKISRAEESLFVWCVYYTILSDVVDTLSDQPDLRPTTEYDGIRLAVIDDPVSSMDDERIVSVALAISDLIKRASTLELKFLVSTHHALFFNVLFNSLGAGKSRNMLPTCSTRARTPGGR